MKWIILLVGVLVIGLWLESLWEKKKKSQGTETPDSGLYSPGEMISDLKGKQDGK